MRNDDKALAVVKAWHALRVEEVRVHGAVEIVHSGRCGAQMNALLKAVENLALYMPEVDPPSPAISTDDDQHDPLCSEGEYRGDQRLDCDCSRTGHPSVSSRPDQAATEIEATNDGNTYVFCDHVERVDFSDHRGCVRGAGHNGPHVFQQRNVGSPMLMPVVLQVGSVSVSAQRSEHLDGQERSEKQIHQPVPDPAIEQAKEEDLRFLLDRLREFADYHERSAKYSSSGWHDDTAVTLRDVARLIESSASRLQEVETENDYLRRRLNNENWKQAAADFGSMAKRAEKAELRLQEVEAERDALRADIRDANMEKRWENPHEP